MLSSYDSDRLERYGFTKWEIEELGQAKDAKGNPQDIDLNDPVWDSALKDHLSIMQGFYDMYPGSSRREYERFINQWFIQEVGRFDPWIWIDQNYFRRHFGISKDKWSIAYKKV